MLKLLVFDLDSTLAPIGRGMEEENVNRLRELEKKGVKIAVCSGKSCDYLCGFLRQLGLSDPIMIGENGASLRFGVDLPPKICHRIPLAEGAVESLQRVRRILEEKFGDQLWFQPSEVEVTPFPKDISRIDEVLDEIQAYLEPYRTQLKGINMYRHVDCFDIVPEGVDKGVGVSFLLKLLELDPTEMAAIGDTVNDYPMFEVAGLSVGVAVKEESRVDVNCSNTKEMLLYLTKLLDEQENEKQKSK